MRGISSLVGILLIMFILMSLASLLWLFTSGTMGSMTQAGGQNIERTKESISTCMIVDSIHSNNVYLKNCGDGIINNNTVKVYLDDSEVEFAMTPEKIRRGEVGTIKLRLPLMLEGDYDLKIANSGSQTVQRVRNQGFSCSLDANCVLALDFDEGSGSITFDFSIYQNNGNLNNMGPENWVEGRAGSALYFSGYEQYVRVNNIPVDTASGAKNTVDFWMYWYGTDNQMPFGWDAAYDLWLVSGCFGFNTGEGNVLGISSSDLKNRWVRVTAVFHNGVPSSSTVSLFIDGVKRDIYSCFGSTTASSTVTSTLQISSWVWGGYHFNGIIDSFRVFRGNQSLTENYANTLRMK